MTFAPAARHWLALATLATASGLAAAYNVPIGGALARPSQPRSRSAKVGSPTRTSVLPAGTMRSRCTVRSALPSTAATSSVSM